jgi:nicotinamidase-related amidase
LLKERIKKLDDNDRNNNSSAYNNITFIKTASNTIVNGDHNSKTRWYALQKPRYAILVIDMLNDFVYGKLKIQGAKKIIPKIATLVNAARQKNIPIFYCIDEHVPADMHELKLWGYHAMKGTEGAEIVKKLKPSSNDCVIQKRTYSAFHQTNLHRALMKVYNGKGADTVIISGLTTDICTRHTAYDAFIRGFSIVVAEDGTTAFTEEDHVYGLKYMQRDYGVKVSKTADIVESFERMKHSKDNNDHKQHHYLSV